MKYLQNRESFSFSTSSKTDLFSDDEDSSDDHDHLQNHTGGRVSGHHQNDYFEISLPPPPPSPSATKTNNSDSKDEEFEFCFSFNSSSTLVDFPTTPGSASSNHPFHHDEPPMTTTTTFAISQSVNVVDRKHNHHKKKNSSMSYKRIFQNTSSPRCHQGLISPYTFPPSRLRTLDKTQRGLMRNYSTRLGGIRKFMVKLRSMKSMLRSSLNASKRLQSSAQFKPKRQNKSPSIDDNQTDYNHIIINKTNNRNDVIASTRGQKQDKEESIPSKKMKFIGFSKIFSVIMRNIKPSRRSKHSDSKSCPVSIKSSPMHDPNARDERRNSFYSRDHSIQAAIAHCKRSFGK